MKFGKFKQKLGSQKSKSVPEKLFLITGDGDKSEKSSSFKSTTTFSKGDIPGNSAILSKSGLKSSSSEPFPLFFDPNILGRID